MTLAITLLFFFQSIYQYINPHLTLHCYDILFPLNILCTLPCHHTKESCLPKSIPPHECVSPSIGQ